MYTAGYVRTKSAADRFTVQAAARRPVIPAPSTASPPSSPILAPSLAITPPQLPVATPQSEKSRPTSPSSNVTNASAERATKAPRRSVKRSTETSSPIAATTPAATAGVPAVAELAAAAPVPVVPEAPKSQYKDGTYFGWGTSRHGDIQAQVVIENGRIASATIAQCLTRYSCSVIAKLPPQVAERQSPETDYVSGATQSTNAFYYAVVEALSKAK